MKIFVNPFKPDSAVNRKAPGTAEREREKRERERKKEERYPKINKWLWSLTDSGASGARVHPRAIHLPIHISSYIRPQYVPNVRKYNKKSYQDEFGRPLAQHGPLWDNFWNPWAASGSHLGCLGSFLGVPWIHFKMLGDLNATQSCPECNSDSQSRFGKRFFMKSSWILLQSHVFEGSSKVVFLDFATVSRFQ